MDNSNKISHDFNDESMEAKAIWFKSLSMTERIDLFCDFTDLALNFNPDLADKKDDQSFKGRIQIISNP